MSASEPDPEPEPRSPQPADDVPRPNLAHWPPTASREPSEPYHNSYDRLSPFPLPSSFFDDAIAAHQPSPSPPASFLDYILNPISRSQSHSHEPTYLPFGYQRPSSPQRRPRSPVLPYIVPDRPPMSPARQRPSRLPNGYVDLTHDPEPTPAAAPTTRRKRGTPTPGPSAKRTKHSDGSSASTAAKPASSTPDARIDEIDLSDDRVTVQEVLQKQRVDAVKAQTKPEEKPTTFNSFTCVICMDTPTDITATSCGHLFCHTCLMEALIAGENRAGPNEPKRSQCPVCRKFINRTKASDVIPLLLKKGLATQPRKSSLTATAKS